MMSVDEKDLQRSKDQAKAQLKSIIEAVNALYEADANGQTDYDDERMDTEAIRERIQEKPLEVSIREGWHAPGMKGGSEEYSILLCTGGPAVRIVGVLGRYHEPESAWLEYQDWFTPWTEYRLSSAEEAAVLGYAQQFYFGG